MERILRIFTKESGSINQAALLLGCFTLLSQILALFRDRSIAHFIGPSPALDAYYAAFRVPDLIFICIASLASITVLIPFIVAKMAHQWRKVTEEARKYLNDVFTVFFSLMVFVALVAFFLMPYLIFFIAPGFTPYFIKQKLFYFPE
jgi:putative peptidoglycan lipid II flippase